jgi:hypothetical protein
VTPRLPLRATLTAAGLLALLAGAGRASAQAPACEPQGGTPESRASRASPYDSTSFRIGGQEAKICYNRPAARERAIFGALVPWDQLWRMGANEPTTLHLPFPAEVAGIPVGGGKYSIYTVPSTREWVVVVNASTSQGGLTRDEGQFQNQYTDEVRAQEVGRALVPSERITGPVEQLTIRAEASGADAADLIVEWENTRVRIPVRRVGG